MLTSHDLMLLQGKSPLSLARHLEQQQTIDDLAAAQKRIGDLLPLLMREGARASHITRVVAELNDRLMTKILELAEAKLGPPPVPYCWVVLGSEGRREQTFKTDQDNALIYADPAEDRSRGCERILRRAGGLRAGGAGALRLSGLHGWLHGQQSAMATAAGQPGKNASRHGSAKASSTPRRTRSSSSTCVRLRATSRCSINWQRTTTERLKNAGFFKSILGCISITVKPPLGFFRTLVVERSGDHKEQLDLKSYGTSPIVNAARLFALDAGVEHTNTVDRLATLQSSGHADADVAS